MAAPDKLQPRLLRKAEAAAYCAMTPSRLSQLVKVGTLPGPIPGTTRWDRAAIDRALDKLSGLTADTELSDFDKWLAEDGERAA